MGKFIWPCHVWMALFSPGIILIIDDIFTGNGHVSGLFARIYIPLALMKFAKMGSNQTIEL